MNKHVKNTFWRSAITTGAPKDPAGGGSKKQSPLKGLIGQHCKKAHFFPPSCVHLIGAGAHLGKATRTSAAGGCSPLMEMKTSGERNNSQLINSKSISSQLLRAHLLLGMLLQGGARVLLISDRDDQDFPGQIIVGGREGGAQNSSSLVSCGGVYPGTCSNWTRIREEVWNLVHSCQFFGVQGEEKNLLSPSLREKEQRFKGLVSFPSRGIDCTDSFKAVPSLFYSRKPDVLLLISSKENSSLVAEAQAARLPIIKVTKSGAAGRKPTASGGVLELSGNSKSVHWMFLLSALLCQLSLGSAAPKKTRSFPK